MSYIGNQVGNRFVASQAATRFSGNGSNKVFTLEHSVGSDEDILVSVDGVIQEPSISYVVSDGTTLTFTTAPSSGTNNIYLNFLAPQTGTVTPADENKGNFKLYIWLYRFRTIHKCMKQSIDLAYSVPANHTYFLSFCHIF